LLLDRGDGVRGDALEMLGHLFAGMADDHDGALRVEFGGGCEDVAQQAPAADLVEDLGVPGLHTGALARREDDDGSWTARAHWRRLLTSLADEPGIGCCACAYAAVGGPVHDTRCRRNGGTGPTQGMRNSRPGPTQAAYIRVGRCPGAARRVGRESGNGAGSTAGERGAEPLGSRTRRPVDEVSHWGCSRRSVEVLPDQDSNL